MIKKLKAFSRRPFVRNVATVAAGTAASQAIAMAFTPLITRLYGPEVFGLQSIFMSVVSLLVVVAAMGYPAAIVLPKLDADAIGIAHLSIRIALAIVVLSTFALHFVGADLLKLLNAEAVGAFIYLIPVATFVLVLGAVLGQWLIRKKAYSLGAKYSVFGTFLVSSVKLAVGFVQPTAAVLILTNTIGSLMGTALTYLGWRKHVSGQITRHGNETSASARTLARQYIDFPLLRTPQQLINAFSQSLPVLILAGHFGAAAAGQYAIAIAVLGMPTVLIGNSIMAVFYPRINEAVLNGENARMLIIKATAGMAVSGALPFILILFAGPELFRLIFGPEWQTAGVYAQILSPWIFLQYVNKPAVYAVPALRMQGGLLVYELFSTGTKMLALWIGFAIFKSDIGAIALFSFSGVIAYGWLILWVIKNSGKANRA